MRDRGDRYSAVGKTALILTAVIALTFASGCSLDVVSKYDDAPAESSDGHDSAIDAEIATDAGGETDSAFDADIASKGDAGSDTGLDAGDPECRDEDGDGFYIGCDGYDETPGPDCDDADSLRFPGALELCDGVDSDCDPSTPFEGEKDVDGDGFRACAECNDDNELIYPGAMDLCDGVDSDCDPATPIKGESDGDSDGVLACADCDDADAQRFPGNLEVCDGTDNDCDNVPDESDEDVLGTGGVCDGEDDDFCKNGTIACGDQQSDGGYELYCSGDVNIVETCDAIDNDCDGVNNEGLFEKPDNCNKIWNSNPAGWVEVDLCPGTPAVGDVCGECRRGDTKCIRLPNGSYDADGCVNVVPPGDELCDGFDTDCDALADEEETDIPGFGYPCDGLDGDFCNEGTVGCSLVGGVYLLVCGDDTDTNVELCNGEDDDCDHITDEGNPEEGLVCSKNEQGEEVLDGVDCREPEEPDEPCGICAYGSTICLDGDLVCKGAAGPGLEICDGLDNDCDGTTDESDPDLGTSCETGLLGVCAAGTRQCVNGALVCTQTTAAFDETCDGLDNDCDGENDEELGFPCFGFFVFADSQLTGVSSYMQTAIDQMALIDSDAIAGICVGDLTNDAADAQWILHDWYIDQMFDRAASEFGGEDPRYLAVLGNHDTYADGWDMRWTAHLPGQSALGPGDPSVGVYYSLTYENVLVVVMDSEHAGDPESSWQSDQTEMLATALTESTAEFKFLFFHRPVYACVSAHQGELGAGLPWVDLAETHGVDVIFSGHTHVYTRSHPLLNGQRTTDGSGVVQVEVGPLAYAPRSVNVSSYTITGTDAEGDARSDTYNCSSDPGTGNLATAKSSSRTFCHVQIEDCLAVLECYVVGSGNATPFDTWVIDQCS